MRFDIAPDGDGIAAVRHGLGTENVAVTCRNATDQEIGYKCHFAISPDEIEVATVPGSGVTVVDVEPLEPDDLPER